MVDDKFAQAKSVDVLNSRGLATKREYVQELERRRDAQSLLLLVECLCDESWYLRELAEGVFLRMGRESVEVLLPLLEKGLWFTRTSAARILGRIGYRPAVPGLFRLTEDVNETVAAAARDALVAIGSQKGAVWLAHALHRMPPDLRRQRVDDIAVRDRTLSDRLVRLMRSEALMAGGEMDSITDDSPAVRAAEEGVEWEVRTDAPPPKLAPGESGGGNG